MLTIKPISLKEANAYVVENHRHHDKVVGHKFSLGCYEGDRLCGVAIVGNPLARRLMDGLTLEVNRLCTDGTHNACSILYGRCARVAKDMGYKKIITYILETEDGSSLKASGWTLEAEGIGGGTWNKPSRPRQLEDITLFGEKIKYPINKKKRFVKILTNKPTKLYDNI